ncbi:MAG: serine/threonine protein kinase, partial [Frankiales bacterium]|nr:serine/threonine protein kinase [Frankiales bacterium]
MDRLIAERYRLLSPLGSGGMGTVWRAEDELLHREVAVKEVLLPAGLPEAEREQLRERTRREARHAARLDSPHAVTVYDVVEQDGQPFLVMELVEAQTLSQVVRGTGPLPPRRVAEIGLAVLSALDAAHAQGIVHRDVKPSNVLLRPDGRVVLSDFGIARATGDAALTSTGQLLGSPSYIAPERARGLAPTAASDLWSLGATLFTAVEGRAPYDTGDALTTMTAIVAGEPVPFALAGPLQPVLAGLLERDPAARLDAHGARRGLE